MPTELRCILDSERFLTDDRGVRDQSAQLAHEVKKDLATTYVRIRELESLVQLERKLVEISKLMEDINPFLEGLEQAQNLLKG